MFIQKPPGTDLAPLPVVLVTCRGTEAPFDRDGALTVAWTGIVNSEPPMLSVSVRRQRFSHAQIEQSGEFVVHPVGAGLMDAMHYCGTHSGFEKPDKIKECGLTLQDAPLLAHAKVIAQAPLALCCRVVSKTTLPSHDVFFAEIVQTLIHKDYADEKGGLCLQKAALIGYGPGGFVSVQ